MAVDSITIRRPDDWHVHLRDGAMLTRVAPYTARQFARAIIMPNLAPPVTSVDQAAAYRTRILAATGPGFTPLMTAYLTDDADPDELARGHAEGVWVAAKLYPAGATTNSASGVTDIRKLDAALERMQSIGMPLLVHGEVTDPGVDMFDREAVFIDTILLKLLANFPELKVVLEHVTTREAVDLVIASDFPNLAATITPQHLMLNRNALFDGGLRPHAYCLPVVKREAHRLAVRQAATSGSPKFFLGTDSAPHEVAAKQSACGCAGIFNAPFALEAYASVFDEDGALDQLEAFASLNGPAFYGLAPNDERVTLERGATNVPETIGDIGVQLVPFLAGQRLGWRLAAGRLASRRGEAHSPAASRARSRAMIVPIFLVMLTGSPVAFTVQQQAWDAATSTAYLDVTTGDLDGDGRPDAALLKLVCADGAVTDAYVRPRDIASGMPTGKRQHGYITITKEWGPSSPQFRGVSPTYDVKKMEGGKTMAVDDWTATRLNGLPPGVCASAATTIIKSKSNIPNN